MKTNIFFRKKFFDRKCLLTTSNYYKKFHPNLSKTTKKTKVDAATSPINSSEKENIEKNIIPINSKARSSKLNYDSNFLINLLKGDFLTSHKLIRKIKSFRASSRNELKKHSLPLNKNDSKIPLNFSKKFRDLPNIEKLHYLTNKDINAILQPNENSNNYFCINKNNSERINRTRDQLSSNDKKKLKINNNTPLKKSYKNIIFNENLKENQQIFDNKIIYNYTNKKNKINNNFKINNKKAFILGNNKIPNNNNFETKMLTENDIDFINQSKNKYNKFDSKNDLLEEKMSRRNSKDENDYVNGSPYSTKINKALLRRSSVIDRLVFNLEKPLDCFEEHVIDEKPGDKYQLLKNQLAKEKNKIYKIIYETKKSQIKSEVLMRKYCFKILSKRNKNENNNLNYYQ